MTYHAKADRWCADLSDPLDGQDLQEIIDAVADQDDDDDDGYDDQDLRDAARELQAEIDRYSNTLRKLQMGWAKHQTELQQLIIEATTDCHT